METPRIICHLLVFYWVSNFAISAAIYRGAQMPDIENSRKTAEKGADWVTIKQAEKQPEKQLKHSKKQLFDCFFGCFGCFSGCFSAALP